jgi:hypothetical protein
MDVGGMVYHALNRANFRSALFKQDGHYQDFLDLVEESLDFVSMRILAYCLMPNRRKKVPGTFSLPRRQGQHNSTPRGRPYA